MSTGICTNLYGRMILYFSIIKKKIEGESMKVICFGDSLTRGVSVVKGRLRIIKDNYPSILQDLFSKNNQNDINVVNKGVFNDNSDLLLSRLEKDVVAEKPNFAIVGIGGNDCNFKWENVAEKPFEQHNAIVPLDRYLDNLKAIIIEIERNNIVPIIPTLPPLDPVRYYKNISEKYSPSISHWISKVGGIEHWQGLYNQSLIKFADGLGIRKVDVRTAIKKAGDLADLISDDGIHLTAKGYNILSKEIYQTLKRVMKNEKIQHI